MDEKTIKVRQCSKMSAFEVFDSLLEFDESLAVVNRDRLHLTDMKMAQILFSKLDALTDHKSSIKTVRFAFVYKEDFNIIHKEVPIVGNQRQGSYFH